MATAGAAVQDEDEVFKRSASTGSERAKDFASRALHTTGKGVKRGLEWLFGIESSEDEQFKWEARQRRLNRLRTQVTMRQRVVDERDATIRERPSAINRTGRDPQEVIQVNVEPKPHVWELAWRGLKHVTKRVWEGPEEPPARKKPERFYEIEGSDEDDETDAPMPVMVDHDFFGDDKTAADVMDGPRDAVDGAMKRRSRLIHLPPSHIPRQKPIDRPISTDQTNFHRKFKGLGLVARLLGFHYRRVSKTALESLDKLYQHRPYFTYWVTTVHILVMIIVSAVYGFAPYGFDYKTETALIQRTNLGVETVQRTISTSVWGGPSQEDLVLLGARYAPCMRNDRRLFELLDQDREEERQSGCCVSNDRSGCVQVTTASDCSRLFSQFYFNDSTRALAYPEQSSRVVCNLSPITCIAPASSSPHYWDRNDITNWPICQEQTNSTEPYLTCELTGRPCCIGILAACVIATQEFCDFMDGTFHEEAFLCSQVSCLDDVCGLIPFVVENDPDQFYRIWLSLFLHAGWIHLFFTFLFHFFVMRDVEKHIGWFRVGIIYLGSGFAGNIFSGTFIPYQPEVGPAGSIMGIMATLMIYVFLEWSRFTNPVFEISKLAIITLVIFIIGLLPFVDNFAHIGGFISGLLLSAIFLPYYPPRQGEEAEMEIFNSKRDKFRTIKIALVAVCIPIVSVLYILIFTLFYEVQPNCYACQFITCIPFTDTICQDQQPTPSNRNV